LRRIARSDEFPLSPDRPQGRQGLDGRAGPVAGVACHGDRLLGDLAGCRVSDGHGGGDRYDLVGKKASFLRLRRPTLASFREEVLSFAADTVTPGHHIGSVDHLHVQRRLVLENPWVLPARGAVPGTNARNTLDASG